MVKCDFSGWATRNDLRCDDGRIFRKDSFKGQNGKTVSLVWNHQHSSQDNVLGHALHENREEAVYAYCTFNETESGKTAKELVQHGDVVSLSIWANQLKQTGHDVVHGVIRELSLVLAGANPGAFIDTVMVHGVEAEDEMIINYDENIMLYHSADDPEKEKKGEPQEAKKEKEEEKEKKEEKKDPETKTDDDETVGDVWNTMTEKQQNAAYAMIAAALEEKEELGDDDENNKGGNKTMKHNVFDQGAVQESTFLSHADQVDIINLAKSNSVGSLRTALNIYLEQNRETLEHSGMDVDDVLAHGITDIEKLFPEFRDVRPGAPERITRDQGWVTSVMSKAYKTPFSRIRTRQMDARSDELRARGYKKGSKKEERGNMTLYNRTTDPQTVFVKDKLNRDDIVDITDFEVADYIYQDMREKLNEEIAIAIMVSDGRIPGAEGKIDETHIRPIWGDDEFFTMHVDIDLNGAKTELQGTNTGANFSENYIYAEAIIRAALYSREKYKGTGQPDFYCTPHLVNIMLLARDMNGRRIYDTVADLAKALNVGEIHTAEQFDGLTRETSDNKTKELLGIFVNMADYTIGSTKGGEITRFNQFDIDFNQEKYLLETRLSGALTRYRCAIALEKDVTDEVVAG